MPAAGRTTLAVAATFSCEPVGRWLTFWLAQLGSPSTCVFASYGQLEAELRRPQAFRGAAACIGLIRFADWQRGNGAFDRERFESNMSLFLESVAVALRHVPRLLCLLCPGRPSLHAGIFVTAATRLHALAATEPRLAVIDMQDFIGCYAVVEPHDVIADELGHLPYTEPMWCDNRPLPAPAAASLPFTRLCTRL